MKCCTNIVNIGCFDSCTPNITTGLTSDAIGIWKIEIDYMGITKKIEIDITAPATITIPNNFNEDYEYIFRVYRPDGTLFNNTCYSFKTYKVVCN